jgi:hypothetical protein
MGDLSGQVGSDKSSLFDLGCSLAREEKNIADGSLPDFAGKKH